MRTIALTKGYITLIDDEDYQRIMAFGPWMALVTDGKVYAAHSKNKHTYLMHRFILGLTDPDIEADTEATKHFGEFACTNAMLNLL